MRTRLSAVSLRILSAAALGIGLALVTSSHAFADDPAANSQKGSQAGAATYSVEETAGGKAVFRNGEKVTEYLTLSGRKPILWPVIGPDGVEMTRGYPMQPAGPQERDDHIHHRSLWFTHGEINGVDFWAETENAGMIKHREFTAIEEGPSAKIATTNDWLAPNGERVLSDERLFVFSDQGDHRVIDVDVTLRASDGEVHFGDTKEGSFGIRIAGSMKLDAEPAGSIVTSRGVKDGEAWGTEAEWVDYFGPIDGKTYGIAIMNHPSSFGFPNRWHVRSYGLFAANPFGEYHFVGGEPTDGIKLAAGETLRLRYRVLLHRGATDEAQVAAEWQRYKESQ